MQGARAVQRSILEDYPDVDIGIGIVWIEMLQGDNEETARRAAASMPADPRVRHFHDPKQRAGRAIARSLGGGDGNVAWDIYLFYEKGKEWGSAPPMSADWMHQLTNSSWAPATHYHSGGDLVIELHEVMDRLLDGG